MPTTTNTAVIPMVAVLDADDRVIVMFGGSDAAAAAQEWHERGYRTVTMER